MVSHLPSTRTRGSSPQTTNPNELNGVVCPDNLKQMCEHIWDLAATAAVPTLLADCRLRIANSMTCLFDLNEAIDSWEEKWHLHFYRVCFKSPLDGHD